MEKIILDVPMTNASVDAFNSTYEIWTPFILILIAVSIIAVLTYVSSDLTKYRKIKNLLKYLSKTFSYCAYGMLTVAVIGFPLYFAYLGVNLAADNVEATGEVLKWAGIMAGCFIGFTLVGYITKERIWKRIFKYHNIEKQRQEYKENIKDLPGGF